MGKHEKKRAPKPLQIITFTGIDVSKLLDSLSPPLGKDYLYRSCHDCADKKKCKPSIVLSAGRIRGNSAYVTLQGREMRRENPRCTIFSYFPKR